MRLLQRVIPTGCSSLDALLKGGFPASKVTLVYGEAETGKTTLALQCAINCARMGLKTFFIDPDGTFSARRLVQIAHQDYEERAQNIVLTRPTDFKQQSYVIHWLEEFLTEKFGLVVVDTITSLYRSELGDTKETFALNRELNRQVAYLAQIAKAHKVVVLITSQVRSTFQGDVVSVEPVATRVLKFWSDVIINLKPTARLRVIKAVLEKHPNLKRPRSCYVRIERTGVHGHGR